VVIRERPKKLVKQFYADDLFDSEESKCIQIIIEQGSVDIKNILCFHYSCVTSLNSR